MAPIWLRRLVLAVALAVLPWLPDAAADLGDDVVDLTVSSDAHGFTNSLGMKLVRIPQGKFLMGAPEGEKERRPDEKQHEVEITKDFCLGAHEVTQKQWKALMGYNGSYYSNVADGKKGLQYGYSPAGGKAQVQGMDTSDFPVDNVSYDEAVQFCDKLTAQEKAKLGGRKYRLPTEAEWEYACRAGTKTRFSFGDELTGKQANFGLAGLNRSCKVGSYPPNAWGLYDMHGNVWEWVLDWYDKDYFPAGGSRDPSGPPRATERMYRGGGWNNETYFCRAADRRQRSPADRVSNIGFRVALVAR